MTPPGEHWLPAASTVIAGSAWALALRIGSIFLVFASTTLFARAMPSDQLGLFFVATSVAAFISLAIQFGLSNVAVRDIGRAVAEGHPTMATALARGLLTVAAGAGGILILLSFAASAVIAAIPTLDATPLASVLPSTAALATALAIQSLVSDIFRGHRRIIVASLFGGIISSALMLFAVAVLLGSLHRTLAAADALALAAGASGCTSLVGAWLTIRGAHKGHIPTTCQLLQAGRAFWLNGMTSFLFFQADLWIAGLFLSLEQTALYGAASRLAQALALPIDAAELVLPSLISGAYAKGQLQNMQRLLQQMAVIQTAIVGIGAVTFLFFGSHLLQFAFGADYGAASGILTFLALGWLARASMGACGYTLSMTCHADILLKLTAGLGLAFLPIYLISAQVFGAMGIAVASALALASVNGTAALLVWQKLKIRITAFSFRD